MSEELVARLMARIAVPPMPIEPRTYEAGRMDQFTEMIAQLRALPDTDGAQVLADATARIESIPNEYGVPPHTEYADGVAREAFRHGIGAALAALNQPQTEKMCRVCRNVGPPGYNCSECDGGGAATAAGVADADLEGVEVHINGSSDLSPDEAKILGDAMKRAYVLMKERQGTTAIKPTPYAKAFREKFPVPEFPGIKNRQEDQA